MIGSTAGNCASGGGGDGAAISAEPMSSVGTTFGGATSRSGVCACAAPAQAQPMSEAAPISSGRIRQDGRPEEHTSELQSLMRISYAGYCLKKKIYSDQRKKQ